MVFALMTLGGLVDPVPSAAGPAWPGLVIVVILAVLIGRAIRLGMVIDRDDVTTRGLLMSRNTPTSGVLRVEAVGYSGQLNWYGQSRSLRMLRLDLQEGHRDVPMVIAFSGRAHAIEQRANTALGEVLGEQV